MSTLRKLLSTTLVLVACAVVSSACCVGGTCNPPSSPDAGPPPAPPCAGIACATSTAGCDPATIHDDGTGQVCASCTGDGAPSPVDICGKPDDARCESRENAVGATCELCATSAGEILFDSCFKNDPVPSTSCERTPGSADSVCTTCTDASGVVVSTKCEPASDECHDENGCRVCTSSGKVVITDCAQPDIQPRSCEAYENDAGRCVDCFGQNDELLTHSCTLSSNTFIACAENTTQDGLVCTTCTDASGAVVSSKCDSQPPILKACERLDYTEQTCVVCVDANNSPGAWQCSSLSTPNTAPPECFFETGADGALCRTCPVGSVGATEQRCFVDTHLTCTDVQDPTTFAGCLSCSDDNSGVEVYRRCDGTDTPPICGAENSCEVCEDPFTAQPFYASCGAQTCFELGSFQVSGATGTPLFVADAPAVATCTACGAGVNGTVNASDFNALCSLRSDCGAVDLTNPSASCASTVVFTVAPKSCNNPWEAAGYVSQGLGSSDELVHVLAFALESRGVALVGIDNIGRASASADCTTPRGDLIEVVAQPSDAQAVSELFSDVLVRCASDADCASGACRVDGSCTAP